MLRKATFFLLFLLLSGCIKQYIPIIESNEVSKILISGRITDQEGFQYIKISKSIPIDEEDNVMVTNCRGSIWDENGKEFPLEEIAPGKYRFFVNKEDIQIGRSYFIQIFTPDGEELISEPDIMTAVAPANYPTYHIDSIYNSIYNTYAKGLQFNVDISGDETSSKFYLFELYATYEHHAKYPREWYYDGWGLHHISPPDSSLMYCWTTERIPEVLTLSTENLTANQYKNFGLHFVTFYINERLSIGYSLLLRQFGVSKEAFIYWESMRLNNNGTASLYNKQPIDTKGNITNLTHPEKEVLGFFSASAVSESRIFVDAQATKTYEQCFPEPLDGRLGGLNQINSSNWPAFLMTSPDGTYEMIYLPELCVNCATYHGSPIKPEFWPY
ncbi:MAG: DUF4249 domain-containing protein [Bacteroidales bacterium]|nr:DUF4249 domain-containing protein [Bacteroidales bacterium]